MRFLLRAVFAALGLYLATLWLPGLHFATPQVLIIAGVLLGLINAFLRPVLVILTLPITILTLGLFLLVINAAMVALVAWFLRGMHVADFSTALLTAITVSVVSLIGHALFGR
jgi:putative membrane protein